MDIHNVFSNDMSEYITTRIFQAEETIVHEDEDMNTVIYLQKGNAKCLMTQENGKIGLVDLIAAPWLLGDMELVGAQKSASGIVAITDCTCQIVNISSCRQEVLSDVKFLQYLCQMLGKAALRNAKYISMIQTYPLRNRLITFLLQVQYNGIYTGPLTEASDYLGVSYRHLLYVLAQLVEEGMLKKEKGVYQLCDMEKLQKESIAYTTEY